MIMNPINHFIFSFTLFLLFRFNQDVFSSIIFSLIFAVLIDLDHLYKKIKKSWDARRTWIQEPFGLILIGFPLAFLLSFINRSFLWLTLIPYSSHIFLDYLCVFEAFPLAPFSKIKKPKGMGIFVPFYFNWKMKGKISENYFLLANLIFLLFYKLTY